MKRSEIEEKYKWDLTHIYKSPKAFESDLQILEQLYIDGLNFKGKINNAEAIFDYYCFYEKLGILEDKLNSYAMLYSDTDKSDKLAKEMNAKLSALESKYSDKYTFFQTEIFEMSDKTLRSICKSGKLGKYIKAFAKLIKLRPHILSKDETEFVSKVDFDGDFESAYNDFKSNEIDMGDITLDDGIVKKLTVSLCSFIAETQSRETVLKAKLQQMLPYKKMINTIGNLYIGSVKKNVCFSKLHKYKSVLDRNIEKNHLPASVYKTLMKNFDSACKLQEKFFIKLKNKLNLDKVYKFDMYNKQLNKTNNIDIEKFNKIKYEESVKLVKESLSIFGSEYNAVVDKAFNERWIDVYETDNKMTGGYNLGVFGVHPYILLNYSETLSFASTIAHEMGHCVNNCFISKNNDYIYSSNSIFNAEIASMVNEVILSLYLMEKFKDNKFELFNIVRNLISSFLGTYITQCMFSKFEEQVHTIVEEDKTLTVAKLTETYLNILKKTYRNGLSILEFEEYTWSYIPHFYSPFYVYKYATGIVAAFSIASKIFNGDEAAKGNYIKFLKAGSDIDPYEKLKIAGVDLSSNEPYKNCFNFVENLMNTFLDLCFNL